MIDVRPPRWILALSYFTYALAGMFFLFWGPNSGLRELLGWGFWIWNSFLLVGGLIGALGVWIKKFRIEIIASPFLVSSLSIYGGYLFTRVHSSPQPGVIAGFASVFTGAALLFGGKGLAIWIHKIRVADAVEQRAPNDE